jgi:hypothetical protein
MDPGFRRNGMTAEGLVPGSKIFLGRYGTVCASRRR